MDYTNKPEVNMQPDTPNFTFLAQLYGTVDGSPVPVDEPETGTVQASEAIINDTKGKKGGGKRSLRQQTAAHGNSPKTVPATVASAFDEIDHLFDEDSFSIIRKNGWRKLHESKQGGLYELDMEDGFTIQIHLLKYLAPDV